MFKNHPLFDSLRQHGQLKAKQIYFMEVKILYRFKDNLENPAAILLKKEWVSCSWNNYYYGWYASKLLIIKMNIF